MSSLSRHATAAAAAADDVSSYRLRQSDSADVIVGSAASVCAARRLQSADQSFYRSRRLCRARCIQGWTTQQADVMLHLALHARIRKAWACACIVCYRLRRPEPSPACCRYRIGAAVGGVATWQGFSFIRTAMNDSSSSNIAQDFTLCLTNSTSD